MIASRALPDAHGGSEAESPEAIGRSQAIGWQWSRWLRCLCRVEAQGHAGSGDCGLDPAALLEDVEVQIGVQTVSAADDVGGIKKSTVTRPTPSIFQRCRVGLPSALTSCENPALRSLSVIVRYRA